VVLTLVVLAVVGVIAYQVGWSDGFAQHVPAATDGGSSTGAPYPYHWYGGAGFFHFGWIFGLLFFLFFVFVFFRIVAFGLFGGWRRGWGYGPGRGWGMRGGGIPPAIDERMREWHRQAHEAPPAPPTGTATTPPPPPEAGQ
jgi:hypothetical protein